MFLPSPLRQPDTTNRFSCDPGGPLEKTRLCYGGLTDSNSNSSNSNSITSTLPAALLPIPYTVPPTAYQQGDVAWSKEAHKPGTDSHGLTWDQAEAQLNAIKAEETA
jgi:hypothetical protein